MDMNSSLPSPLVSAAVRKMPLALDSLRSELQAKQRTVDLGSIDEGQTNSSNTVNINGDIFYGIFSTFFEHCAVFDLIP